VVALSLKVLENFFHFSRPWKDLEDGFGVESFGI